MLRCLPVALALSLSLIGCVTETTDPDPTDSAGKPKPPPPSNNLTGTVFEPSAIGPIPLAGATVYVHQPGSGQFVKTVTTDKNGRYATSVTGYYVLQVNQPGYEQPCVADGTVASGTSATENIELYSDAALSAGRTPPLTSSAVIVGTVSRNGEPVADAYVTVTDAFDLVLAITKTSSQGSYFVCRVPDNEYLSAFDAADGSQSDYYDIGVATNETVDLTLL